jgi:CRISPR-associated protein Csb2
MPFSISAELPLGTYRGHDADGTPERIPSVARLHAALLCAAGFGPRAVAGEDGELAPCAEDAATLRWLEHHPPDGVSIPPMQMNSGAATAYRDDGTLSPSRAIRKLGKAAGASVAVGGALTWSWLESPPPRIVAALEALCPDVPHLGSTESPARLTTSTQTTSPTHVLDQDATEFSGGEDTALPTPGRIAELAAAHAATRRVPTLAKDKVKSPESSESPIPPRGSTRPARYTRVAATSGDVPWPEALLVPLSGAVSERDRVRFAVAAHRTLIGIIGDGAPPVLTGAYPPGGRPPANRIALQLLSTEHPVDLPAGAKAALAVLLPRDVPAADLAVVLGAVRTLRRLRAPYRDPLTVVGHTELRSGESFWREPAAGTVRLWRTEPAAVPDTRGAGPDWTFGHTALLSVGFVWQSGPRLPAVEGRGTARYRALASAVNAAGAAVVWAEPLRTSAVGDYAHRVHPHAVVRPYRAVLSLGDLGGPCLVQAIGQSRHLGGGLLVPVDLPEGSTYQDATR